MSLGVDLCRILTAVRDEEVDVRSVDRFSYYPIGRSFLSKRRKQLWEPQRPNKQLRQIKLAPCQRCKGAGLRWLDRTPCPHWKP